MGFWDWVTGKSDKKSSSSSGSDAVSKKMDKDTAATMPKNSAADDLMMDLGLKEKNEAYYRDLSERQARTEAHFEQFHSGKDDKAPAVVAKEEPKPEDTAAGSTAEVTPVDAKQAEIDRLLAELEAGRKGKFNRSYVSGPSEEAAIEYEKKGRQATILTAPRGIMDVADDKRIRARRSLLAG